MDNNLVFVFLIAVLIVGVIVLVTAFLTSKHTPKLDQEQYQIDFLTIQNSLQKENPSSYSMTIIKGDKLLDKALCEIGTPGRTMGDRLKKVGKERFSELNSVWHAHKLRGRPHHRRSSWKAWSGYGRQFFATLRDTEKPLPRRARSRWPRSAAR